MNLFSELITAVQSDLTIGDESTLFTLDTVKLALNRANLKATGLFGWPELEDAKMTSSVATQAYYDYPQGWRSDSIFRLEMDDDQYGESPDGNPMKYVDYLQYKADSNNDNATDKKWANQERRYFIEPVPTTNGVNNICIWGRRIADGLVDDGDVTIFSYSMPECNDAIVLEAVAILKSKGEEEKSGEFRSIEAKGILIVAWSNTQKEQSKYEKVQPFLDVPDFYSSNKEEVKNRIGRF